MGCVGLRRGVGGGGVARRRRELEFLGFLLFEELLGLSNNGSRI